MDRCLELHISFEHSQIHAGIDSEAEEAASKQLPGRSHQIKAQPKKAAESEANKTVQPETETQPVDRPQTVHPASETEEKHETPKQTMVDPTSVWGLNDNQDNQRRNAKLAEPKKDQESFDAFGNDGQDSISQIETSAQDDDDDNSDIPFFKHRGEN